MSEDRARYLTTADTPEMQAARAEGDRALAVYQKRQGYLTIAATIRNVLDPDQLLDWMADRLDERERYRAALALNGIHLKDRNDWDKMWAAKQATEAALGVEYDALTRTEDDA